MVNIAKVSDNPTVRRKRIVRTNISKGDIMRAAWRLMKDTNKWTRLEGDHQAKLSLALTEVWAQVKSGTLAGSLKFSGDSDIIDMSEVEVRVLGETSHFISHKARYNHHTTKVVTRSNVCRSLERRIKYFTKRYGQDHLVVGLYSDEVFAFNEKISPDRTRSLIVEGRTKKVFANCMNILTSKSA